MAWLFLIVAGLLEIVWALTLDHAATTRRFWPAAAAVVAATVSFVLLGISLKTLPVGTAYAVWVGIGALGVTLAGAFFLGETLSASRMICVVLIIAGVIGLKMSS